MDKLLSDSLYEEPRMASGAPQRVENLLRLLLKAFFLIALCQVVLGVLNGDLLILAGGFYSTATFIYVAGLLLVNSESVRPSDGRYSFGYGNRAAVLHLGSMCVLAVASIYLFFRTMASPQQAMPTFHVATLFLSIVMLVASAYLYRIFMSKYGQGESQPLGSLRGLLRGAVVISAIICVVIAWGALARSARVITAGTTLGIVSVITVTLYYFIRSSYETFCVVTDKEVGMASREELLHLAHRAGRDARVLDLMTRNSGGTVRVELTIAFPASFTIQEANAVERDIGSVLRRKFPRIGQVVVNWIGKDDET